MTTLFFIMIAVAAFVLGYRVRGYVDFNPAPLTDAECAEALFRKYGLEQEYLYDDANDPSISWLAIKKNGKMLFMTNNEKTTEDILDYYGRINADFKRTMDGRVVYK
jgi:hypothetical protein